MNATEDSQNSFELDHVSKEQWNRLLKGFYDATFFQTWEYGVFRSGGEHLSHAVLKLGGRPVAAVQVREWGRFPSLKYAYIDYGPMWRPRDMPPDCRILDLMLTRLAEEYVTKRGYSLSLFPFIHAGDPNADQILNILQRNRFTTRGENPRTLLMDISPPLEDLRRQLRRKWRQDLRYAEEADLDVTISKSQHLFAKCLKVYNQMRERKGFDENVSMDDLFSIHALLPEEYKFTILTVGIRDRIDACLIYSAIGNTGFPVLAATALSGLQNSASYLAYWELIKLLKAQGIDWFDLRGIDPQGNPGGYCFKTGLTGKKGREVSYLGHFDFCPNTFARSLILIASQFRHQLNQRSRRRLNSSKDAR
jgi:hypothetical protein